MEKKSSTFMVLGTVLGMLIAFVISFILFFFVKKYNELIPFLFLGLGFLFRFIGYGLDRIVDKKSN